MPLLPEIRELLERIAALGDPPLSTLEPAAGRELRRSRQRPSDAPIHSVRDVDAGGIPARLYRPNDDDCLPLVVHFHGGGWVTGDLDTSEHLCRLLARRATVAVLSVDYRLAPEHPFPAAVEDALAATSWAFENATAFGCDPSRLAVSGESAGGTLATVVAALRPVPIRHQLLVYPVTDLRCASAGYEEFAEGFILTAAGMRWFSGHYLAGGGDPTDPRASPRFFATERLAGSAPAHVVVSECDVLRDEAVAYADQLTAVGVAAEVTYLAGMVHNVLAFAAVSPAADAAVTAIANDLIIALA